MAVEQEHVNSMVGYLAEGDYSSLTTLLQNQPELAQSQGNFIFNTMRELARQEHRPFDYGWQLSGEQFGVIAELRRAGTNFSGSHLSFDYVARVEAAKPKGYDVNFPDLPGCVTEGETIKEAVSQARNSLAGYIISKMNHGELLPEPKYRAGKNSKRIKRKKITLTLDELV